MARRLTVLVTVRDSTSHVGHALEQVCRSDGPVPEIVVLCSPSVSRTIVERQQTVWLQAGARCLFAAGMSPGAVRNAGIETATGDLVMFLDAGDVIDRRYVSMASRKLVARPKLAYATAWARHPGVDGLTTLTKPTLTLRAVLGDREAIPPPTIFRRSAWDAVGRFDEDLVSLEWFDFWIRLIASGHSGTVIEELLIGHEPSRGSAYRNSLDPERHTAGARAVLEKQRQLFQQHLVTALCDRETNLRTLARAYGRLLTQRDELVRERSALQQQVHETVQGLRELGGEPFDWGDLRRVLPVSADWGYERGIPVDRYYIERFLESHAADVQGAVLEIQESDYTRRFGGERVARSDVVDINADNPRANHIGDLRRLEAIPSDSYDCFILTQTIHVIDDMAAVLREAVRILKPGGVLLVTLPCASRVCLEYGDDGDFWRVTEAGARRLFAAILPSTHFAIQTFGNVLTNVAFLEGLACHEVSAEEFEVYDPFHPLLVGVRGIKPRRAPEVLSRGAVSGRAAILLYHRVAEPTLDIHGLTLRPDDFRTQMTHLARAYRPLSLPQLATAAAEGWLPDRSVAVTFDDGYVDNLEIASPILLESGIPATFFVTSTGLLGDGEFWWDVLASIFFGSSALPARFDREWNGVALALPTATAGEREAAHWDLYHRVRQAGAEERARLMRALKEWAAWSADATPRPMNRFQLEELARRPGHSIGGHGTDHLSFSTVPADVIHHDVRENRILLETAVGRIVTSFAYPFGDHDDRAVQIVADLGYRTAVTCDAGLVRPGMNPLRLPRVEVAPRDASTFEARIEALFTESARESH